MLVVNYYSGWFQRLHPENAVKEPSDASEKAYEDSVTNVVVVFQPLVRGHMIDWNKIVSK